MYGIVKKLDLDLQNQILSDCREALNMSPLYSNYMPQRGLARRDCARNCGECLTGSLRPFKPKSTSFGSWGWRALPCGYHYTDRHPTTGEKFPPIPESITTLCAEIAKEHGFDFDPQSAYLSWYPPGSTLGRHQDVDEKVNRPVISISLGDDGIFEWGGMERNGSYENILLHSGDVFIFGGEHRYCFHSVKKVAEKTAPQGLSIKQSGRINITIRQYE